MQKNLLRVAVVPVRGFTVLSHLSTSRTVFQQLIIPTKSPAADQEDLRTLPPSSPLNSRNITNSHCNLEFYF